MVDEGSPLIMRIRALVLTALVILSSITSVIASDTVTTQDVEISGNHTMTGNYTVSKGTTLTLKSGTTIDMGNYWLKVDGNLVADNTTIMSSIQTTGAGSHNAGVWDSLTISSTGSASLDNVTVSNAKSCLIVDGLLQAKHLAVADCLIGIEVAGSATIEDFMANDVDIDGLRVTGDADISNGELSDMSGGVHSSGDLVLNNVEFMNAGTGITLTGGTADLADLEFLSGVGNAVSISAGVSGDIEGMSGTSTNAIVSMDSAGFTISDVNMSGERLVNSWSAGNLTISDAVYVSTSGETPIDIRTSGTVTLSDIELDGSFNSNQGSFDAPWIGMALAGSGDYIIDSSTIKSTDSALKASGTGTLTITDSTFMSDRIGMAFSGISATTLDGVVINISSDGEMGIDILQGSHTFTDLEVNMPFNQFATDSTGINAWWCDISGQEMSVNGFANSISVFEAVLNTDDLILRDSAKQGLYASSSMVSVNDLFETRVADNGLILSSSSAVIRTWDASYHDDGGVIDSESEATVWSLAALGNLYADVTGDGVLNYGTSQTLNFNTALTDNRIWEMTVTFEDLTGNPVDADWTVLGFSGTATGGMDTLPVSEIGSKIIATYAGVGAQSTPNGVQGGTHTMQVPIMPQSDWTLTGGTMVVLGPTADGSPHMAGGNVTIPPNAQLFLQDTTLELPEGAKLTVDSYGDFEGSNGHLMGDVISHSADFSDSPTSSMTIHGDVLWTSCQNDIELYNLQVLGDVQLDNSCKVKITSGETVGQVVIGVGAAFEIINTLEITVLDKGEPVQGATVSGFLDGQSVNTGVDGKASKSVTALLVDSSGATVTGMMPIIMQWGSITDYKAWNTSSSLDYTFTASTIDGGSLTEWLELEKAWSPYHLSSDLIIPQGQTMTVNDGVALRVSEDVTITVEGTFNSGYSTIKSTGNGFWGGLIIGDNAETTASILGTRMEEGSPIMVMDGESDVVVSNARLSRSSSAEPLVRITNAASGSMQIISTDLVDSASHCIEAQGSTSLVLQQVVTQSCASNSLWARGLSVSITDFTASQKVDLGGITGTMSGLNGGDLHVNNLDGFMMSDLTLTSINGSDNREIIINGAIVNGAPAVDLDNTAGSITDLQIDCGGSGVGLTANHGRASSSLSIADSTISSCTKGIDLHTDGESAAMILTNVDIDSLVAISSDGNNLVINDGELNGSLDIYSAVVNLFDVEPISISGEGEVLVWSTHIFDIRLNGVSQNADLEVNSFWDTQNFQGSSIQAPILWKYCVGEGGPFCDFTPETINVLASAEGLPLLNQSYDYGFDANEVIQVNMIDNEAPNVQIIIPDDGFRIMESLPIEVRAAISDDLDSIDDLQIVWKATIGQTEMMQLNGEWNNITDLSAGLYVLTLEVTDTQGMTSTDSLSFEVTLLDSDDDWTNTCNSETWFDKEQNVFCGPDVYDTNDDNDEVADSLDPWPTDSCASRDTDNDGQPDDLHCPLGVSTWLTADPDDDGDGIPDVSESAESTEDSSSSPVVIILFVAMFLAAGLFMLRQKKQDVE